MDNRNGTDINFTRAKQRDFDDMRYEDVDLATAHSPKPLELGLAGTKIFVAKNAYDDKFTVSSTLTVGTCLITLNEPQGNPIELEAGIYYDFKVPFDRIFVHNSAQAGKGMRIYASNDADVKPFTQELTISSTIGGGVTSAADVAILAGATTQVLAANASRKSFTISNLEANATLVRSGDSAAGAAEGIEIPIGGSQTDSHTGAVYVYNPSASTINIGRNEIA